MRERERRVGWSAPLQPSSQPPSESRNLPCNSLSLLPFLSPRKARERQAKLFSTDERRRTRDDRRRAHDDRRSSRPLTHLTRRRGNRRPKGAAYDMH